MDLAATPEALLARADALRDGGDWAAAEPFYRAYLQAGQGIGRSMCSSAMR